MHMHHATSAEPDAFVVLEIWPRGWAGDEGGTSTIYTCTHWHFFSSKMAPLEQLACSLRQLHLHDCESQILSVDCKENGRYILTTNFMPLYLKKIVFYRNSISIPYEFEVELQIFYLYFLFVFIKKQYNIYFL